MMWRVTIVACVLSLIAGGVVGYELHGKPAPAPSVKVAVQASRIATQHAAKAESVYVHDTLVATRVLTHYDSTRVRDTVVVDRVVYVNRDSADAAVHACRAVFSSCAATVDSLHGVIRAKDTEIAARDADRPSRLHTLLVDAALVAGGYTLARAGIGARMSVPLPFLH